jgi:hypothetical protein
MFTHVNKCLSELYYQSNILTFLQKKTYYPVFDPNLPTFYDGHKGGGGGGEAHAPWEVPVGF